MGIMCDTYSIKGHEVLEKKVSKHGTGGHLYLPASWVGEIVKVVRTTELQKDGLIDDLSFREDISTVDLYYPHLDKWILETIRQSIREGRSLKAVVLKIPEDIADAALPEDV